MLDYLDILGRTHRAFEGDIGRYSKEIDTALRGKKFLVVGGGGSVGRALVKQLFSRGVEKLHVVDLSENNLAELVRDIRSSLGYGVRDFKTYCVDCDSLHFRRYLREEGVFDWVINVSALKHVRSERDPYTLMRMVRVNVLNTWSLLELSAESSIARFFSVSSDKAVNPANVMGATKRVMELILARWAERVETCAARFANVAFSDGSLLDSFWRRLQNGQPLSVPTDIKRFFITQEEAGLLCLASVALAETSEIFFPKPIGDIEPRTFLEIAERFLSKLGLKPVYCSTEEEAREMARLGPNGDTWPVYTFESDTSGEKYCEELFYQEEEPRWDRFDEIGVADLRKSGPWREVEYFVEEIRRYENRERWNREEIIELFRGFLDCFRHVEKGKSLDERM